MAPIHDTDVAKERWDRAEWAHYELWEKIEARLRRRKRLWIALTVVAFFALSSIPIVNEWRPRWEALAGARRLAREMGRVKADSARNHRTYRLSLADDGYSVEETRDCASAPGNPLRSGSLGTGFAVVPPSEGAKMGLDGLSTEFCYSPLEGAHSDADGHAAAFALAPAADLASGRSDRAVLVLVSGASAQISIR